MALQRWNPFNELANVREMMDRVFEDGWSQGPRLFYLSNGVRALPIDMYETSERFAVRAQIPGVRPDDVTVTVEQGTLTLKCHIPTDIETEEAKGYNWLHREVAYGDYVRTIALPAMVDADKVDASFDNGVLTLHIPKAEAAKPREIKVKAITG